jgi:hypothetical protein
VEAADFAYLQRLRGGGGVKGQRRDRGKNASHPRFLL